MKTKICKKCWIKKSFNDFHNHKSTKDRKRAKCKECRSKERIKYHSENKEYVNKKARDSHNEKMISNNEYREVKRIRASNYRAKKITTSDWTITIENTKELFDKQGWCCNHCWIDLNKEDVIKHLDHIHPISTWWTHSLDNVQRLCKYCNLSKWNRFYG